MMDVIGNNIANVNTIGFKAGRATFAETFAQTLRGTSEALANISGTNAMQVGLGMAVANVDTLFSQGNLETTGQTTDLAIQGNGFFIVSDGSNRYYTRAGDFQLDAKGNLVMPSNGKRVQGFLADSSGNIKAGTALSDIVFPPNMKVPAKATSKVELAGNLDASAKPLGTILNTSRLYAVEKAGATSKIEGLRATGSVNDIITGLIPNSTTITISDSVVGSKTYKYVDSDSAVGNGTFSSLDDLVAEINNDFGASSLTASLDANGAIQFTDVSGATNQLDIQSSNSILEKAFSSAKGDLNAGPRTSDQFAHTAGSTDLLVDLRDANGASLGLATGDEITINGLKGGNAVTPLSFTIGAATTYQDFARDIENAFSLANSQGVVINSSDGSLTINGDGGTANALSALDITADNTPGAGGTARTAFNGIFGNSSGNYIETQKAEDVKQSASYTVFDSQGNSVDLTVIFTKDTTTPNRWKWEASLPSPATATGGNSGVVEFNADGSLKSFRYDNGATALQIDSGNAGASPLTIDISGGKASDFNGITQMSGASSAVQFVDQDGHSMGILQRVSIDQFGRIDGNFSNGINKQIGQIALADFNNPGGLVRTGESLFSASNNSGIPVISTAGKSISAQIVSGALEQSNVDLAEEFTRMIIAQRGFQANARVITTSDDLLAEVSNLKR